MKRKLGLLALAAGALVCTVILAACGSSPPILRALTVAPTTATIDNGTTQQFTATAYYSDGTIQPATTVTWTSSNPAVASITSAGVASGLTNGATTITATLGAASASASLTVSRTLESIAVAPASATLAAGATQAYTATGTFLNSDGSTSVVPITSSVTWNSSNTTAATIDNTGLATALAAGSTNISASLDGITSPNAVLTVGPAVVTGLQVTPAAPTLAVGNTTNLVALELFSDGTTQPLTGTVTWAVSGCTPTGSSTIASTTTNGTEIAIGDLAGTCTVTATEAALTGTSAVTVVAGSAHFAYISNSGDSTISQYAVSAASTTAPLTPLTPATVAISTPVQLVINPNGKFVYAIDSSSNISQFDVDPAGSGTLTLDPNATVVVGGSGTGANFMVIDPSGRFMYVSDDGTSTIDGFTIDPVTGFLTPIAAVTGYTNGTLQAPEDLLVDRSDQYLYATNSTGNTVSGFTIGLTGGLTPLVPATYPTGATPLLGTIDGANNMYIADSGDNTVAAFSISPTTGALGVLTSVTVTGATAISNAVVDPTSAYLYVLDSGTGSAAGNVYGYTLATTGAVGAAIPVTPVATGINPIGITIDPSGTLLAVDNNNDNTITPFSVVTTTGTPTAEATVSTGVGPLFLAFYNAP